MNSIIRNIQLSYLSTLQSIQKIKQENERVEINISSRKLSLAIQAEKSTKFRLLSKVVTLDFSFITELANNIIKNDNINIQSRIDLACNLESLSICKSHLSQRANYYLNLSKSVKKQREELEKAVISQYCRELSESKPNEFVWQSDDQRPSLSSSNNPYHGKIVLYSLKGSTCCTGVYRDPLSGQKKIFELNYLQFEEKLRAERDKLSRALALTKEEETRLGVFEILPDKMQPGQLIIQKESPTSVFYQVKRIDKNGQICSVNQDGQIIQMTTSYVYGLTNLKNFIMLIQVEELKKNYPNLINLVRSPEIKLPPDALAIKLVDEKPFLTQSSLSLSYPLSVEMKALSDEGLREAKARLIQLLSIGLTTTVSPIFLETCDPSAEVEIPPMPKDLEASELKFLLEIFDQINFFKSNKRHYRNPKFLKNDGKPTTPKELRKGLAIFVQKINDKLPHLGVPGSGDSRDDREKAKLYKQERIKFYDPIERLMRHNVLYLKKQLEQASREEKEKILDEIQGHVLVLAEGGLHCGGRWRLEALELYKNLTSQDSSTDVKGLIHQLIDRHKVNTIASMAEEGLTNPHHPLNPTGSRYDMSHGYLFILRSLTQLGYKIPLAEVAVFDDMYEHMGQQGAYTTKAEVQKGFNQKCSAVPILNLIEEEFNNKLRDLENGKSDGLEWARIENGLRDLAKASTETSLSAKLDELQSNYEKKKAELVKKQKEEQRLSDEEQKLLDRLEEDRLRNEEIENLQIIQDKGESLSSKDKKRLETLQASELPILKKDEEEEKEEIDFLKNLAQNKPDKVKSYQEALRTKNISVKTFQEQINGLTMLYQVTIDDEIDEWLKKKGFFDILEDENGQESKRLTIAGVSALLRYFGAFDENLNLKALRDQKELYRGKISTEQIDKLLQAAKPGNWILTESPAIEGQLIVSKKKSSGKIEHIHVHPDWSLETIKEEFNLNKALPLSASVVELDLLPSKAYFWDARSAKTVEHVLNESVNPEAWLLHFDQAGKLILSMKKDGWILHTDVSTEFSLNDIENMYDKTKAVNTSMKLSELQSKPYYWGAISNKEASRILLQAEVKEGTWLMRYSKKQDRFVISQKKGDKVQHTLVPSNWSLNLIEKDNSEINFGISKALSQKL